MTNTAPHSTLLPQVDANAKLAAALAAAALLSVKDEESAIDRISPFLAELYALPPSTQAEVVDRAIDMLCADGEEPEASGWLLDELEFQAQTQEVVVANTNLTSVVFAIPVMTLGDTPVYTLSPVETEELANILQDCEVIADDALVQLAPALYSVEQLLGMTWGEVANLAHIACSSDLQDYATAWAPAVQASPDDHLVKLRFVLGVFATTETDPGAAFPELEPEDDEEDDSSPLQGSTTADAFGFSRPGFSANGTHWTELFKECLERAAGLDLTVAATLAPEGFYFDILAGLREWRALTLRSGFDAAVERKDLDATDLYYEIQPGPQTADAPTRFLAVLYTHDGGLPALTLEWLSLPEEPDFQALDELLTVLEQLQLLPYTPISDAGLRQLH